MQWHQSSNGFLLCVLEIQIPFFLASFSNKESSFPCLRPSVFKDFTKESEAKLNSNGKCEYKEADVSYVISFLMLFLSSY